MIRYRRINNLRGIKADPGFESIPWHPNSNAVLTGADSYAPVLVSVVIQNPNKRNRGLVKTATIIAELEAERDRLSAAIQALSGKRPGRRPGARRKSMSPAARAKISAAQKKRW